MTSTVGRKRNAKAKPKTRKCDTIPEWMNVFERLYHTVDVKQSPVEMWVAATAHFTRMGEAIRRMHFPELMHAAAHGFCWMCSFVLACQREKDSVFFVTESFSEIVAWKYPLVCGHCGGASCQCNSKTMDEKKNKAANYRALWGKRQQLLGALNAYSVPRWLDIFNTVYGHNIHMSTLESVGFHFLEEAGEELTALRTLMQLEEAPGSVTGVDADFVKTLATCEGALTLYEKDSQKKGTPRPGSPEATQSRLVHAKVDMFIEFADTFSWFCSILNKVAAIARNCNEGNGRPASSSACRFFGDNFSSRLLEQYLTGGRPQCPTCHKCPCKCVFYHTSDKHSGQVAHEPRGGR